MAGEDVAPISQASEKNDTRVTEKMKDGTRICAKTCDEEVGQSIGYFVLCQETASVHVILVQRPSPVTHTSVE